MLNDTRQWLAGLARPVSHMNHCIFMQRRPGLSLETLRINALPMPAPIALFVVSAVMSTAIPLNPAKYRVTSAPTLPRITLPRTLGRAAFSNTMQSVLATVRALSPEYWGDT
ncbi:hypothetical protein GJV26_03205 [Massilia dura]|uniref:Uncharacterized protein n=1 Tax=Pseudoduganella dura TaxID=321982 RepID=A0A6I3XE45_9BURK|nr:hypothetical protein [Pseudoduganella dura]MUI11502.1 hypothetical protein [Pseudoduganella dura]GGX97321.1 hypothetical protein GCM10007386_30270 [Pseudoduganella dura]